MKLWITILSMMLAGIGIQSVQAAPPDQRPALVRVTTVQERTVAEKIPIVGTLNFERVGRVSTEVAGLVQTVSIEDGDRVNKGDTLITLNTDLMDQEIGLYEARIRQMDIQIEKAGKDFQRFETLFQQNAVPEKTFDDTRYFLQDLEAQKQALSRQLAMARIKKEKSAIRAPFDGLILEKYAHAGDYVGPGVAICRLASLKHLRLNVAVNEALLPYSRAGDPVDVTLTATGETVQGIVDRFSPVADAKTKNLTLKIKLPPLAFAAENMSATAHVPIGPPRNFTVVPRDALASVMGEPSVYTIRDGRALPLGVKVAAFIDAFAAVEGDGIVSGATIILEGHQRLRPDQPVQVIPPSSEGKTN